MESITALGVASNALEIVTVLSKAIKNINELQSKYRRANLTFTLLENQLITLKSALEEISEWDMKDCSPQLVQGSESATQSISILVTLLDEKLQSFQTDAVGDLTFHSKVMFLWDHAELKEYFGHLNSHIMSLSVLLYAHSRRSPTEQQDVMNDEENIKVMRIAEDGVSSLIANDDVHSRLERFSIISEGSENWSQDFAFDRDTTNSRVYRLALRSNMRNRLPHVTSDHPLGVSISPHIPFEKRNKDRPLFNKPLPPYPEYQVNFANDFLLEASEDPENTPNDDAASITTVRPNAEQLQQKTLSTADPTDKSTGQSTVELSEPPQDGILVKREMFDEEDRLSALNLPEQEQIQGDNRNEPRQKDQMGSLPTTGKLTGERRRLLDRLRSTRVNGKVSSAMDGAAGGNEGSEQMMQPDEEKRTHEIRILLLGAGEVGKSTILESMRQHLTHGGQAYDTMDRKYWREIIRRNIIGSFKCLFQHMEEAETAWPDSISVYEARTLERWIEADPELAIEEEETRCVPEVCLQAMPKIWNAPSIQQFCVHENDEMPQFYNSDSRMASTEKIFQRGYLPSDKDILEARIRTNGISQTVFDRDWGCLRVIDTGGERSQRKKWIYVFEDVHVLVFVAKLVAYERVLWEDKTGNSIKESFGIYEAIVNSRWFNRTGFVVVFTHCDLFQEKVKARPTVWDHFKDFDGDPRDVADICSFFEKKFRSLERNSSEKVIKVVYTGLTDDPSQIGRDVLEAAKAVRMEMLELHDGASSAT